MTPTPSAAASGLATLLLALLAGWAPRTAEAAPEPTPAEPLDLQALTFQVKPRGGSVVCDAASVSFAPDGSWRIAEFLGCRGEEEAVGVPVETGHDRDGARAFVAALIRHSEG